MFWELASKHFINTSSRAEVLEAGLELHNSGELDENKKQNKKRCCKPGNVTSGPLTLWGHPQEYE